MLNEFSFIIFLFDLHFFTTFANIKLIINYFMKYFKVNFYLCYFWKINKWVLRVGMANGITLIYICNSILLKLIFNNCNLKSI